MTDIINEEKWAELEREIHDRFGVNACVYDKNGFTFTGQKLFNNPLCPAIKARPEGLQAICSTAHQNMAAMARSSGETVIEECDAGLLKICTPVFVNGDFIGVVGGCGRLPADGEVDDFAVKMASGIPEEEVRKLAAECKVMREEEAQTMAGFLEDFVREAAADTPEN
jgi:ligand-binding sensor protein